MPALVQSESSFGAYVCHMHRGLRGSTATSDLVIIIILIITNIISTHCNNNNFRLRFIAGFVPNVFGSFFSRDVQDQK